MISVVGAGAFGTALAVAQARQGSVTLWARDAEHVAEMRTTRENTKRLPGTVLAPEITVTEVMPEHQTGDICLLAVPMQRLRGVLEAYGEALADAVLIACCKGIEVTSGLGPVALIREVLPGAQAGILTGPGFARDLACEVPTAMTLAIDDEATCMWAQKALTAPGLRLYRSTDTIGAELGGALKNVLAIGCGAVMGAGLGESARAALMTRGFAEMMRLAVAQGAEAHTLEGLSGFGDLVLTCTSSQSRNYRFGYALGEGQSFDPSVTVEGAPTARAVLARARSYSVDMPVTAAIVSLIDGSKTIKGIVDMLLSRPLKEE